MPRQDLNVVFIMSDDQGSWAAGCYGNSEIRTPNIDRIARTGIRFANFFVASPVCSPSRASFLTGRIPSQHGVLDWIRDGNVGPEASSYLAGEIAYTDILAQHGWTCGISGKWHLGNSQLPQHGFSHWFLHQSGAGPYNSAPMVRDGQLINAPGYVTNVITDDALEFIDAYSSAGPFYLSVHYTAPHSPWTGHPKDIVASYHDCPFASCPQEEPHPWSAGPSVHRGNRESLKGYFAAVTAMDIDVGRILDKLEEKGILDSTLVVFTSDNGFNCGHHGIWGKGNATNPPNMYESSITVPAVMSQPGTIPENRVTNALVSGYDFMPTLLELLDLPIPNERDLPGRSFLPLLLGQEADERESVVVYQEYGDTRAVRTPRWKYVDRPPDGPHELYDLDNDPNERSNLVQDASRSTTVRELRERLDVWFSRYVVPTHDGRGRGVTGAGHRKPLKAALEDGVSPFHERQPLRRESKVHRWDVESDLLSCFVRPWFGVRQLTHKPTALQVVHPDHVLLIPYFVFGSGRCLASARDNLRKRVELGEDCVYVHWEPTDRHRAEFTVKYALQGPNSLECTVTVRALESYRDYEVILSSSFEPSLQPYMRFSDAEEGARWLSPNIECNQRPGAVALPKDPASTPEDWNEHWRGLNEWDQWVVPGSYALPLIAQVDRERGVGAVLSSDREACSAVCWTSAFLDGLEDGVDQDHNSESTEFGNVLSLSLLGRDMPAGSERTATVRLMLIEFDSDMDTLLGAAL